MSYRNAGYKTHKPDCGCFACKNARNRAAQGQPFTTGAPEAPPEVVLSPLADEPSTLMAPGDPQEPQDETSGPKPKSGSAERWDRFYAKQQVLNASLPPLVAAPGRSARDRVATWLMMRTQEPGITNADCARRMGLLPHTLSSILSKAVKEGWLKFEDPLERIEHEIIPKTLDNLSEMLDQKSEKVTIATAKGTVFPMFQEAKGIAKAATTVLAIKIEPAPLSPAGEIIVVTDQIVGKPLSFHDDTDHEA